MLHQYEVILEGEPAWYIYAGDDEEAAWSALELSKILDSPLLDVEPMAKKYYPNRWKKVKDIPAEMFEPLEYDDLMELLPWELVSPDNSVLMRATNHRTGKVEEYAYKRSSSADERLKKLLSVNDDVDVVVATEAGMVVCYNYSPEDSDDE